MSLVSSEIQSLIDILSHCRFNTDSSHVLKVKGLVFDFGSVLYQSTKQFVKELMHNALCQSGKEAFHLSELQTKTLLYEFKLLKTTFKERKLFLGTGTCFDEGYVLEYTLHQMVHDALIKIGIPSTDIKPCIIDKMCAAFRKPCIEHAQMVEGVIEFLQWCQANNIRCGICSNYFDPPRTQQLLVTFGIKHFFDIIIISGDVGVRKPDYRIIEPIFKKWNDLQRSEIVFVGDNARRDTLLAHFSNIRSILCRFTAHRRENNLPSHQRTKEKLRSDSFVNLDKDIEVQCVSHEIGYTQSEAMVTTYDQIPNALYTISTTPYTSRPLVVGLFVLPHKIDKFAKRNVFHMKHRRDIICKAIDFDKPLHSQGPFDIFIHKIASWYVAAQYDIQARAQLHRCLEYINASQTNIKHKLNSYNGHELKSNCVQNNNLMFVTDDPENAKQTCDRMTMYRKIIHANIKIGNITFSAPNFVLVKHDEMDLLRTEEGIKQLTSKLKFPIIAKPRLAVSPVVGGIKNLKSCAHTMCIIPDASMIYQALSSYKSENHEETDWILQEYVNHSGCHKVYVVGTDVFVTVNDSTPRVALINNNLKYTFIDSGKYSKTPLKDQSGKKIGNIYNVLSLQLSKEFGLNCFGYDLIFDCATNNGYIVDCNYLPGYKCVPNFSAVFWGFVLKGYFKFRKSNY